MGPTKIVQVAGWGGGAWHAKQEIKREGKGTQGDMKALM